MKAEQSIHYLTPSSEDDGWQLTCLDVGRVDVPPGSSYPPFPRLHPPEYTSNLGKGRVLSEYQLLFIAQGEGSLMIGPREWRVGPGTAFLLFPGICHSYTPDTEKGWVEYWAGFRGPYPDTLVRNGFFSPENPVYALSPDSSAIVEFQSLIDVICAARPGYRLVAASVIIGLLARFVAARRSGTLACETGSLFEQCLTTLEDRVADHDIDWNDVARSFGLPYPVFTSHFHEYTGLTPHQYWLGLKVSRAKRHLLEGKSVKETAYLLGFESEFYFSRFFKAKVGVSPSKWGR